jgi:hypothetical protein
MRPTNPVTEERWEALRDPEKYTWFSQEQADVTVYVEQLRKELDEANAKIGILMQPKPGPILEAEQQLRNIEAALRFPWEMMRLWCINRDREKADARAEIEHLRRERDELSKKLTVAQALLDGAHV